MLEASQRMVIYCTQLFSARCQAAQLRQAPRASDAVQNPSGGLDAVEATVVARTQVALRGFGLYRRGAVAAKQMPRPVWNLFRPSGTWRRAPDFEWSCCVRSFACRAMSAAAPTDGGATFLFFFSTGASTAAGLGALRGLLLGLCSCSFLGQSLEASRTSSGSGAAVTKSSS